MVIIPLAAESLGVRSSAFFIETADVKILIDPGVSLAPRRFGLPPHPLVIKAMNESLLAIKGYAVRAEVVIITHYHFDHFDPTEPIVFNCKVLLIKHPKENINVNQRERETIIIDHHLLRDPNWKEEIAEVFAAAKKLGKKVVTAAGFLGKEDEILEAHRRQLFECHSDAPEEAIRRNRSFQLVKELTQHS